MSEDEKDNRTDESVDASDDNQNNHQGQNGQDDILKISVSVNRIHNAQKRIKILYSSIKNETYFWRRIYTSDLRSWKHKWKEVITDFKNSRCDYFFSSFLVTPFLSLCSMNLLKSSFFVSFNKIFANLSDGLAPFLIHERMESTSTFKVCLKGSYDHKTSLYPYFTGLVCSERTTL